MAQTVVSGIAQNYPGQQIVAYRYLDLFSNTKEKIGSTKIDDLGHFTMSLPIHEDQFVVFTVNRINAEVFFEADKKIDFVFHRPARGTPRTFANTNTLGTTANPINFSIQDFDREYERFLEESSFSLKLKMFAGKSFQKAHEESLKGFQVKNIRKSDSTKVAEVETYEEQLDLFEKNSYTKYQQQMDSSPFFKDYIDFSFAKLKLINVSKDNLYDNYLTRKLNFENPAVVEFFKSFYNNIWQQEAHAKKLISILKNERNYYSIDTAAASIPYLEKEEIRHLAIVNGLYQAYNAKLASQEMILTILVREAKMSDSFATIVATNFVNKIIQYKKGVKLKDFKLLDKKENIVTIADIEGKFVYINFFTSWCNSCEGEMYIMNNLKKKYGKEISFVSINMDDDYSAFKTFLSKHRQFDWKFLYGPSEDEILKIFNVQTIPTYLFIDSQGNWINANTKAPSEGVSNDFDIIMRKAYQAPKRYQVWDD